MESFSRNGMPGSMACKLSIFALVLVLAGAAVQPAAARDSDLVRVTVLENTPDRIVLQYAVGDYAGDTVVIDGREYTHVTLGKEALMLAAGAPELPHVCRSVIIPGDAEMAVKVLASEYRDVERIAVAPSKGSLPRTVNPEDVPYTFGAQYAVDADYPGELASLGEPYVMRDLRGVVVELKPFQYNPVKQTLRAYSRVTLEIVKVGPGQVNVLTPRSSAGKVSLAFHNIYQHHFLNYDPAPRYAPLDEVGNMLIICYDSWLSNIQPLVTHKNSIGIATTAVGVSTIPGGNTSTAIKNYIQSVYNSSDLAFVLLVGDSTQVATPSITYSTNPSGSSDPSYSLLAGADNYPDVIVGRFSAETAAHVDTQVLRTIEYENMPATTQAWFWRGTGIGSEGGTGDDGEYDYQHIANIRTQLLAHGYTLVDGFYGNSSPAPTASQVAAAVNNGRGIMNYCGHGSTTAWSTTGFSTSNIAALTNDNMLPFIFSVACVNGQFAGYTCFAEAWLRSTRNGEPIGAIGAYMSSINQDWNPPMEGQDAFNALYCAATPAYFCYGTLCYAGSCSMMDKYGSSSGSAGWGMFLTWHIFGDPSLRVIGTVEPPHGLKVTPPEGLAATGPVGGPFSPSKVFTLENKNDVSMDYSVAGVQPWITVVNGSGTISAHSTTTVTVQIDSDANTLLKGNYSDTVNFVNMTDHDGDATRSVALTVGGAAWDPVAQARVISASCFDPTDIELLATDPNNDPLTYVIESLPPANRGLLVDPATGQITTVPHTLAGGGRIVRYLPPFGQTVSTSFLFSAWDATAQSNIANVTVNAGTGTAGKVYDFPMNADPGWSKEGAWAFGHPTGGGSHNKDPNNGYTGTNVCGYNLSGDYMSNLAVKYLTTTALNCSNLTQVELRFRRWLGVEGCPPPYGDHASIQVSNNGTDWTTVWENGGATISDAAWSQQAYSIATVADNHATVYIRWGMGPTDDGTTYPGWNIDDVEIWAISNYSCSGALLGDINLDTHLNGLDLPAFVEVMLDPYAQSVVPGAFCAADMNGDGFVTAADVEPFVNSLLGL